MKPLLALTTFFCFVVLLGCKDDNKTQPIENPISSILKDTVNLKQGIRASGPWELGIVFSVGKSGKITQVGSRMPDPGSYRLLIWDFDSKVLLRQKTVEQSAPGSPVLSNLEEQLPLIPDKKYVISINSHSSGQNKRYYFAYKEDFSDLLPIAKDNVLIHHAMYSPVATATFPNGINDVKEEFYGMPEFSFIAD